MVMKKVCIAGVALLLFCIASVQTGCSREEKLNKGISLNEPRKPGQEKSRQPSQGSEEVLSLEEKEAKERKGNVAYAEVCQKNFEACVEHCNTESCEDACMKSLEKCEKELPKEMQTLK